MRSDGGSGTAIPSRRPTRRELRQPPLDPAAREELITSNLGLAHQLARRFLHRGEPLDDLVQVASVALVKSVDRFDPSRGVDFAAFATRTIIGELKRHFRDKGWAVRASRRVQELYLELGHATATLVQQLGRNPTVAELAEATGASEEAVIEAIEAGQGYRAASIDASESEDDPLSARLGEHDGNYDSVEDRALLGPALATLPVREQSILRMRFVDGLTQSEIAVAVGVSQMHVSRLLVLEPPEAAGGHRADGVRAQVAETISGTRGGEISLETAPKHGSADEIGKGGRKKRRNSGGS